jgi:hypothetical protein
MAHLFERNLIERVNTALLGTLWTALAMCLLAALAYDIRFWIAGLVTQERARRISGPPATRRSGSLRFVRPAANEKGGRSRPTPSGLPGTAWAAAEGSRLPGR